MEKIEAKDLVNAGFSQYADKTKRMIVDNIPQEFSKFKFYQYTKMTVIFTGFEYANYYNEAQKKYGSDATTSHTVAASQTTGSVALCATTAMIAGKFTIAAVSYATGVTLTVTSLPVLVVGAGVAVGVGLAYDNYKINVKSTSAWIGDTFAKYLKGGK